MTAKEMFLTALPEPSIFTPTVLEYGKIFDIAWELSTGKFLDLELWAVTLIDSELKPMFDISMCFNSKIEAKKHIQDLTVMIQIKLN